jgi:hypothetical protein
MNTSGQIILPTCQHPASLKRRVHEFLQEPLHVIRYTLVR